MKKATKFIIILIAALCSQALAKIDNFGVNFGIQHPNIIDSNAELYSPSYTAMAGASSSIVMSTKMRIQINANYSKYQEEYNYIENSIISNFKSTFKYLSISSLVRYNFANQNAFFISFGPDISYLLSHNLFAKTECMQVNLQTNKYILVNISLSASLGYEFDITERFSCAIEVNKLLGLSDISKSDIPEIIFHNPNYQDKIVIYSGENNYSRINSTRLIFGMIYHI